MSKILLQEHHVFDPNPDGLNEQRAKTMFLIMLVRHPKLVGLDQRIEGDLKYDEAPDGSATALITVVDPYAMDWKNLFFAILGIIGLAGAFIPWESL